MIGLAQQDAGGTLKNLYPSDALSTAYNKDYPLIDCSSKLTMANSYGQEVGSLTINCRQDVYKRQHRGCLLLKSFIVCL